MKHILSSCLLILASFYCSATENYGPYGNGKVTIKYEMSPRGGDLFYSSRCKKTFRPKYDGATEMFIGENRSYVIYFQGEPAHMEVEGDSKCFPEGKYKRIKDR